MALFKTDAEKKKEYLDEAMKLADKGEAEGEKAIAILEKARALDERDIQVWLHFGYVYVAIGKTTEAIKAFKKKASLHVL